MFPGSKVKSEYMKRYKDPRWDMYAPCYRELLHYRQSRRLLEQAHNPWFWDDWGQACSSEDTSSSGGRGSPCPEAPGASPPPSAPASPEREDSHHLVPEVPEDADAKGPAADVVFHLSEHFLEHSEMLTKASGCCCLCSSQKMIPLISSHKLPVEVEETPEQQTKTKENEKLSSRAGPRQQPSALFARGNRRMSKNPQGSSSKIRENKHPFALYGWGEKQTDTGSQKTHNVCASAPMHEIHESALRAKNRRQVEKRKLVAQRQRTHSVDVERNRRIKPSPSDNPWMTEYMRCYSARA
ncbi:PREDICTED: centriole, cilia and spindle-associated protein-like [Elephantulus edwardii]|uniref:centriole, cilia and spindle-associated protein-like n=1 Tax=Elephantulus edwardii TaxID=28737 RepID=UPI0003F0D0C1|nr:PREDICTED: centriole, cilia and spindle-associated protein-like [Elephantulus edwardii]